MCGGLKTSATDTIKPKGLTLKDLKWKFLYNKFTALWPKKNFSELKEEKRIFYNYWDSCITYEKSYFARLNYIYFNPVKHGYVEEAGNYIWGSYTFRLKEEFDYLDMIKEKYPCDKVVVKDDF